MKLKVYKVPIGFHDAYVAAPSQKAAMAAWGSDRDAFARGDAEIVTDPALTAAPLADPGKIVKRLRGSIAEQIAALGETPEPTRRRGATGDGSRGHEKASAKAKSAPAPKPKPKPTPRPSRTALDKAEAALEAASEAHATAIAEIDARAAALASERKALEETGRRKTTQLTTRRDEAESGYREAMRRWRG